MTHLFSTVSKIPLAFGGAAISGSAGGYGFGDISESEAIELLHLAFEQGFRVFDTAPIYGFSHSEQRIGKAFKNNREKVFLVSKSGVTWHPNLRVDMTNDPHVTQKMLEQSLRDLQSDYIDLYMIHWPDNRVDIRKPLEVLSKAKAQGKIKHLGLCNTNLDDLNKARDIDKIEVVQSEFNFFENAIQKEIFPYLKTHQISFMSWGTLDKGILTERVTKERTFHSSDCRSWAPWWKSQDRSHKYLAMKNILPKLAEHGYSGLSLALGYNLSFHEVSLAICGARNSEQLESLIWTLDHLPPKELIQEMLTLAKVR